jgi:hypothetical protein
MRSQRFQAGPLLAAHRNLYLFSEYISDRRVSDLTPRGGRPASGRILTRLAPSMAPLKTTD